MNLVENVSRNFSLKYFAFFAIGLNNVFSCYSKVGRVIELLKKTTHNGFPVVDPLPEVLEDVVS